MKINKATDAKFQYGIFLGSTIFLLSFIYLDGLLFRVDSILYKKVIPIFNAFLNCLVLICIILGIFHIRKGNGKKHRFFMRSALLLSAIFFLFFLIHVLFGGIHKFGDLNMDGVLTAKEQQKIESIQFLYYFILSSHIVIATVSFPFILLTAYKGWIEDFIIHKKLGKIIYPVWLYIVITGPIIAYFLYK